MNPYTWLNYFADGLWYVSAAVGILVLIYNFIQYSRTSDSKEEAKYSERAWHGIGIVVAGFVFSLFITMYETMSFY